MMLTSRRMTEVALLVALYVPQLHSSNTGCDDSTEELSWTTFGITHSPLSLLNVQLPNSMVHRIQTAPLWLSNPSQLCQNPEDASSPVSTRNVQVLVWARAMQPPPSETAAQAASMAPPPRPVKLKGFLFVNDISYANHTLQLYGVMSQPPYLLCWQPSVWYYVGDDMDTPHPVTLLRSPWEPNPHVQVQRPLSFEAAVSPALLDKYACLAVAVHHLPTPPTRRPTQVMQLCVQPTTASCPAPPPFDQVTLLPTLKQPAEGGLTPSSAGGALGPKAPKLGAASGASMPAAPGPAVWVVLPPPRSKHGGGWYGHFTRLLQLHMQHHLAMGVAGYLMYASAHTRRLLSRVPALATLAQRGHFRLVRWDSLPWDLTMGLGRFDQALVYGHALLGHAHCEGDTAALLMADVDEYLHPAVPGKDLAALLRTCLIPRRAEANHSSGTLPHRISQVMITRFNVRSSAVPLHLPDKPLWDTAVLWDPPACHPLRHYDLWDPVPWTQKHSKTLQLPNPGSVGLLVHEGFPRPGYLSVTAATDCVVLLHVMQLMRVRTQEDTMAKEAAGPEVLQPFSLWEYAAASAPAAAAVPAPACLHAPPAINWTLVAQKLSASHVARSAP